MPPNWLRRLPLPAPLLHLSRSALLMFGRLLAVGMIAAFGLAVYVGGLSAIDSIFTARDNWYAEGHLADIEMHVAADELDNFPEFSSIPEVAAYRFRMTYPSSVSLRTNETLPLLMIVDASRSNLPINTLKMMAGTGLDPNDPDGIIIERSLAHFHGVKVGDTLSVKLGKDQATLHVRGIASDAEFLLAPVNPALFVPSKGSLGVMYANPAVLSDRLGFLPVNSILFRLQAGASIDDVLQRVTERARTRLNVDWTIRHTEQFSYRFLEKDLSVFRIMVPVIAVVSALSASVVTVFLFLQWVAAERQPLGVFLVLGYAPEQLAVAFAAMFTWMTCGVLICGLTFAPIIGGAFLRSFSGSIGLPLPHFAFTPSCLAWGVVGVIALFGLAGATAITRVFVMTPRDAMRHSIALRYAPDSLGGALGRMMPRVWLRMPLRSLFRHRIMSGVAILSVALGFGITAAFFISYSSFVGTSVNRVSQNTWDAAVDFVSPLWNEDVAHLTTANGITQFSPYTKGVAQIVSMGNRINLYIGGFDPDNQWHFAQIVAGQNLSNSDPTGILLEQSTARQLGLSIGSRIVVEVQGRQRTATVRGIFSGAMPGEARFAISFHRELADMKEQSTGLLLRTNGDLQDLSLKLLKDPDVQQVMTKAQVAAEILAASGQVTEIIRLGALISISIAGLFIFACVGYTVLLRSGEYQTLRVLGYRNGLILLLIVVEIGFLGLASLCLATPLGALIAEYLNRKLSDAWFEVDTIISLADYLKTFLPGFVLMPLVALPIANLILRVPIAKELRSGEIT